MKPSAVLRKLHGVRYQSHDDVTLELHPGVNAIIGPSDNGKSVFIRLIRWNVFNRPSGFSFRSHWAKGKEETLSEMVFDDVTVKRRCTSTENEYLLSTLDQPLEAVRTDVPEEIKAALRMDECNVQRQGAAPFLLDSDAYPPAEVARILNAIAGLDGINTAHTRIAGKVRENQSEARALNVRKAELEHRSEKLEGVDTLVKESERLEKLRLRICDLEGDAEALAEVLSHIETTQEQLKATVNVEKVYARGKVAAGNLSTYLVKVSEQEILDRLTNGADEEKTIISKLDKTETLYTEVVTQAGLFGRVQALQDTCETFRTVIDVIGIAQVSVEQIDIDTVHAWEERYAACLDWHAKLKIAKSSMLIMAGIGKAINTIQAAMPKKEEEQRLLAQLAEFPTCPQCGADRENWRLQ